MKLLLYLIFVLFISSCEKTTSVPYQEDPKWALANKIYDSQIGKSVFFQLKKEKNLNVIESGWGLRGRENIRCMHCGFQYFNEITIEEARKLLMDTVNLYLKSINENEGIRPFMDNYPFGPENIEIRIFIYNPNDPKPRADKLRVIKIVDGILKYMIGDEHRTTIYKESYQEALSKLGTTLVSNER